MDTIRVHLQRDYFEGTTSVSLGKRIIYGERGDKATVLHFLDPEGHGVRRLEIPDENIVLDGPCIDLRDRSAAVDGSRNRRLCHAAGITTGGGAFMGAAWRQYRPGDRQKTGRVAAQHAILWRPSTFRIQSGRLYAFTADGHAYAMK